MKVEKLEYASFLLCVFFLLEKTKLVKNHKLNMQTRWINVIPQEETNYPSA